MAGAGWGDGNVSTTGWLYLFLPNTSSEDHWRELSLLRLSLLMTVTQHISAPSGPDHGTSALHPNTLCQEACSSTGPHVSSLYSFLREKFQFQSTGKTNPWQLLHWHPPKYLQQLVRSSCSVLFLLGSTLARVPIRARLRHTASHCTWQGDGELVLTPRNLF